ncbi:DNA repair protein RecN [Croceibacter atlanticus]|uniref:DNA repair protein RecN n=1 Tax=Croceibacter atlanticus TaxID=313588 RepID=UPI0030F70B94
MLQSLSIKNFALIEDVNLQLNEGFSIITGETGAGKSILLGALSLLLGKRADLSAIKDSTKKCTIEGVFNIEAYKLSTLFKDEDLDYEDQTFIRREILPSGKSRAFVNDTPVNLSALQALGSKLVDIHSQHETLSLGDLNYQYLVLDTFGNSLKELHKYQRDLAELRRLYKELEVLKSNQAEANKVYDYNVFLLEELEKAALKEGMLEELEETQDQLSNVELLKEHLGSSANDLQQEQLGVLEQLRTIKRNLSTVSGFSKTYAELLNRIESSIIELEDVAEIIEEEFENLEDNPKLLESTNDKLQLIYNLFKKHNVESISELLKIEEELAETVTISQNTDGAIKSLTSKIETNKEALKADALKLQQKRLKAVPKLVSNIEKLLAELGMPNAKIKIEINPVERFTNYGSEDMAWLLSANKGGHYSDIKKAASGGELSRIMLAIKSLLAKKSKLPTIIFDEIDTGVSGEIAKKMGDIMFDMGKDLQVLSITHLPQIAAKGQHHYKVYKEDLNNTTVTQIRKLETEDRVIELAEMLGGKSKSEAVLAHAKSLLN